MLQNKNWRAVAACSTIIPKLEMAQRVMAIGDRGSPSEYTRVATAAFRRTFHHDGKISPGWWGWGVHAHPISLSLQSRTKLQCMFQLSGLLHSPCFISIDICTLWAHYMHRRYSEGTVHSTCTAGRKDRKVGSRRQEAKPGDRTL